MPNNIFDIKMNSRLAELDLTMGAGYPKLTESIDIASRDLLLEYKNEIFPFNPLHVASLLLGVGEHLASCRSIREDAHALVNEALTLIQSQSLIEDLEQEEEIDERLRREYNTTTVGSAISLHIDANTVKPSDEADVRREEFNLAIDNNLVSTRGKIKDYNDELKARINSKGSAANYVQRYGALKDEFDIELIECYRRARCLADGMKIVYSINLPIPELSSHDYLDSLITWHKKALYSVDRIAAKLENFSWSLTGKDSDALKGFNVPLYADNATFEADRAASTYNFKITAEHLANIPYDNVVLRALDFRILRGPTGHTGFNETQHFVGKVKLPVQETSEGNSIDLPPVILNRVETIGFGVDADWHGSVIARNASPIGDWVVDLSSSTTASSPVSAALIPNVLLTLHLVGWND